jgi:large subunit ribosomal protein L32
MPVPKKKYSKSKQGMRRSHDALALPGLSTCDRCGQTKQPHRVCLGCGTYRGRQVIQVESEDEA